MSEDKTKKLNDPGSFEDRVFVRFDRVEMRITKLEERHYDTKPIWERALAEIAESRAENAASRSELRAEIAASRSELRADIESLRTDLRSEFQSGIEGLRAEMKAEFASMQHKMEHELRGVTRKMDVLNQTLFQIQVDQRYFDRQLAELETRIEQQ